MSSETNPETISLEYLTRLDPAPGSNPAPARVPTIYFIGVTTGRSSIRQLFPRWADALGIKDAILVGIDLPLHAPDEEYRRVVNFIKQDELSLGALVTTHKIDIFHACRDLFDEIDPLATMMGEISSISKRDGKLIVHAKDPISSGLALDAFIPPGYWSGNDAEAFLIGAGGSAIAIAWFLTRAERGDDRPSRIVLSNRSTPRIDAFREVYEQFGVDVELDVRHAPQPEDNDLVLARRPPGSLVVNATGLGKDAPGSPLTDAAQFPQEAIAWDLNYRGDLVFLDQAHAAEGVQVEDGWEYFLHGWTQVISEVFDIDIPTSGPTFERLSEIAAPLRS